MWTFPISKSDKKQGAYPGTLFYVKNTFDTENDL